MKKYQVIIIDDDLMARKSLEHLCAKVEDLTIAGIFENGPSAIDYLNQQKVDIIFLDIEMPEMNGLEFIEKAPTTAQIIFTTSNPEYALEAFEYQVADFLKKPLTLPRFLKAVDSAKAEIQRTNAFKAQTREVYVRENGRFTRLAYDQILFFENIGDYVKVQTVGGHHIIHSTLKSIEEKLQGFDFLKVHRSYIINLRKIKDIEENSIVIGESLIPISRANKRGLMDLLNIL